MNNLNSIVDYLKVFNNINKRPAQEPRTMAQAPLANDLEPGSLKDEMSGNFDPSQETHEEYLQRINLDRPFNAAHGGMIGKPGGLVEEGVLQYGVEARGNKYIVDGQRRGVRFADWARENNINNGAASFTDKNKAETALKQFKADNPTYSEKGEHSPAMKKQNKITSQKTKVLNQYAQDAHGVDYKELFGKKDRSKQVAIYQRAHNHDFKYTSENIRNPLDPKDKVKLIKGAKTLGIELNFDNSPRMGVIKILPNGKLNPDYTALISFKNKGYEFPITKKALNKEQITEIMDNNELPEGVKKWNFLSKDNPKGFRFGINAKKYPNINKRMENSLKSKVKLVVASDFSSPQGWMMNSMYRVWKNQTKEGGKSDYKPKWNKDKSKIIGFTDNTVAGDGKTYYGLKKNTPDGAVTWTSHGDFDRIKKFVDITKRVKESPNKFIQKLLDEKGIKGAIRLNDILSYDRFYNKLSETAPSELIKKQIVQHHVSGVGANKFSHALATKDIQLLTGANNLKAKKYESILKGTKKTPARTLTNKENLHLKNIGAKIKDKHGKVYGGGYLDPERQFSLIEKQAKEMVRKKSFNLKGFETYLKALCPKGGASGGRIGYKVGGTVKCGQKQLEKLLFKGGGTTAEKSLIQKIISGGGKFALGMLNPAELIKIKNLVGPAALGIMAAYEAGSVTDDVLRLGKPLDEALAGNWLTKSFMPHSEEFAKQKNLLQSGNLTGSQREYALEMMKMEEFMKEGKRIENLEANKLVENTLDDKFEFTSEEDMNKAYQGLFERFSRIKPYAYEEGITGRSLENEAAMNEYQDSRLAKTGEYTSAVSEDKFRLPGQRQIKRDENYEFASSPIFGGPQRLVNKAPRPKNIGRGPMTEKGRMKLDFSIPGYTPYDKVYTPSNDEILNYYKKQGIRHPRFGQLEPGEGTGIRMDLASRDGNRSIYGAGQKMATGGIMNLKKKW